jgi:hypothetical protein
MGFSRLGVGFGRLVGGFSRFGYGFGRLEVYYSRFGRSFRRLGIDFGRLASDASFSLHSSWFLICRIVAIRLF